MAEPSDLVQRRAAEAATRDARAAWKEARATPDEERTRAAFRACVLAARLTRRAADTYPDGDERDRMIDGARQIEAAAAELRTQLGKLVEGDDASAAPPSSG